MKTKKIIFFILIFMAFSVFAETKKTETTKNTLPTPAKQIKKEKVKEKKQQNNKPLQIKQKKIVLKTQTKPMDRHKEAYKYWDMSKKFNNGTVGIGLGIPYGFFGTNIELVPIQYKYWELINIVANFGFTSNQLFAFGGGLRIYALGSKSFIRPRVTVMFGTNAIIHEHLAILLKDKSFANYTYNETHYGLTVSTGVRFLFGKEKRHGFDIDLNFITYSTINKRIDELSKPDKNGVSVMSKDDKPFFLKFSAGYRFAF